MFATSGASAAFHKALWLSYNRYRGHCRRCTGLWCSRSRDIRPGNTGTCSGTGTVGSRDGTPARDNTNISNTLLEGRGESSGKGSNAGVAKEGVSKLEEEVALQGLGKKIGEHGECGTMANSDVLGSEPVADPEVTDGDVSGLGAGGTAAVDSELDGALIVLLEVAGGHGETL